MHVRGDGRRPDEPRPIRFHRHFTKYAPGSVLAECGETKVLCTASPEDGVPPFLLNSGQGWLTAAYSMLPSSTERRKRRETSSGRTEGRTHEIQRLIGRTLRSVVDLGAFRNMTIWIDCDVLQADGGTRTAAINGAYVALVDAVTHLREMGHVRKNAIHTSVAAVSVGIVESVPLLDLRYEEDSKASVDMNVVMTGEGRFIEVQGTAERGSFTDDEFGRMLALARRGIDIVRAAQDDALRSPAAR